VQNNSNVYFCNIQGHHFDHEASKALMSQEGEDPIQEGSPTCIYATIKLGCYFAAYLNSGSLMRLRGCD